MPSGGRPNAAAAKREVRERDGDQCRYCGYPADCIDHIEPYAYRHNNSAVNLVVACNRCNIVAGGNFFTGFTEKRDWILHRRRPEMLQDAARWQDLALPEVDTP